MAHTGGECRRVGSILTAQGALGPAPRRIVLVNKPGSVAFLPTREADRPNLFARRCATSSWPEARPSPLIGGFCCKSLFAQVTKNSPGRRRGFRVRMWGGPHRLTENSCATSVTCLRVHESAAVSRIDFRRENYHRAISDFCNNIPQSADIIISANQTACGWSYAIITTGAPRPIHSPARGPIARNWAPFPISNSYCRRAGTPASPAPDLPSGAPPCAGTQFQFL